MSDIGTRFIDFLRKRIAAMGVEESGAYEYYAVRAERGEPFLGYERAVMAHILERQPSRLVHAGIGIGPVIAAMADEGMPAVGYEGETGRFAAAEALRASLGLDYELRFTTFPDADVGRGGLLLFTNVGSGWTREQENAVTETFRKFDEVVLDLRLFGSVRSSEEQRTELRRRLSKLGQVEDLPPIEGAYYVSVRPAR